MKKTLSILLALICIVSILGSCSSNDNDKADKTNETIGIDTDSDGRYKLTFAKSIDYETILKLNGQKVTITGYMATLSPINGKYMYLMNLPYQSCPYCVPNTNQLSNTIAVYAPKGKTFDFTDSPVKITGTIETGDFEDDFGYTYNYRIVDASYKTVDSSDASEKLTLWQKISDEGLSSDIYAMFDYVSFMCNWPTYTAKFDGENDEYLYPADVEYFKSNQFSKESSNTYFDELIKRAENIDKGKLSDLCTIITEAKKLTSTAQAELDSENYSYDAASNKFTLINGEKLSNDAQELYLRYAEWLEYFSLSS